MTSKKLRSLLGPFTLALVAASQSCALHSDDDLVTAQDDLTAVATSADGTIACDGATSVQVSISGANLASVTPLDLVLVIDESGSITSHNFTLLKSSLVSLVSSLDALFDNGGRIGVVMFDSTARTVMTLSNDQQAVVNAINGVIQQRGNTCIGCGIYQAATLSSASDEGRNRAMLVLTDGRNNVQPGILAPAIQAADSDGITLYAVGVGSSYSLPELQQIASGDGDTNVFTADGFADLTTTFQSVVAAIVTPEATDAELVLNVNPAFAVQAASADAGSVTLTGNEIRWKIPEIQDQTVVLSYDVVHDPASAGGEKPIHASVSYTDAEHNQLELGPLAVSVSGCDTDSDGVADEDDDCAATPENAPVDASGCSIGQLCPCAGPGPEHGAYVSCVAHASNELVKAGVIAKQDKGVIQSQAAQGACIE